MTRELIAIDKLTDIINSHLESLDVCRNLQIPITQDPNRTDGGNWTITTLRRSGHDHDQDECFHSIQAFLLDLQAKYDVED